MVEAVEPPRLAPFTPPGYQEAWQMVISQLRLEMSRSLFEAWVQPLQAVSFKEGVYRVGSVNSYGRDWVESRLRTRITRLLEAIFNQPVTLHFVLLKSGEPRPSPVQETRAAAPEKRAVHMENHTHAAAPLQSLPLAGDLPEQELPDSDDAQAETESAYAAPLAQNTSAASSEKDQRLTRKVGAGRMQAASAKSVRKSEGGGAQSYAAPPQPPAARAADTGGDDTGGSPRKMQLQRAYGTPRARIIQPERGMFMTAYFLNHWLPLLSHSAAWIILAARSLCYWNPMTGELRNVIETDMSELAGRAAVSVRTVKDVLNNDLVKQYFLRYKVRRVMTPNGVRTAGIILQVRMDDPLTPEDQEQNDLPEEERWYTVDFIDEDE